MTLKDELFEPNKEDIYKQLAYELKGRFSRGDFYNPLKVDVPFKNWTITIEKKVIKEILIIGSGNPYGGNAEYTRVSTPFLKTGHFQFAITNTSALDSFANFFGAQDVIIGDVIFDDLFTIMGKDEI